MLVNPPPPQEIRHAIVGTYWRVNQLFILEKNCQRHLTTIKRHLQSSQTLWNMGIFLNSKNKLTVVYVNTPPNFVSNDSLSIVSRDSSNLTWVEKRNKSTDLNKGLPGRYLFDCMHILMDMTSFQMTKGKHNLDIASSRALSLQYQYH